MLNPSMFAIMGFLLVGVVLAYLIGSIPNGVIIARLTGGIDLRKHGSGNTGTTNAIRVGGWKVGILTAVFDILKGALGTLAMYAVIVIARTYFSDVLGATTVLLNDGWWLFDFGMGISQIAATFGHMHSPFLGFGGGKGIATSFGGFIVVVPWCALVALVCFLLGSFISKYVSVGSLSGAVGYAVSCSIIYSDHFMLVITAWVILALVFFAHRGNIARLSKGEESKFSVGSKKTMEEALEEEQEETDDSLQEDETQEAAEDSTSQEEAEEVEVADETDEVKETDDVGRADDAEAAEPESTTEKSELDPDKGEED